MDFTLTPNTCAFCFQLSFDGKCKMLAVSSCATRFKSHLSYEKLRIMYVCPPQIFNKDARIYKEQSGHIALYSMLAIKSARSWEGASSVICLLSNSNVQEFNHVYSLLKGAMKGFQVVVASAWDSKLQQYTYLKETVPAAHSTMTCVLNE